METTSELQEIKFLTRQLLYLLDIREESDGGKIFSPNYISSCRVIDGEKINSILKQLKKLM